VEALRRTAVMECLGPQCASMVLEWLRAQSALQREDPSVPPAPSQRLLFGAAPYQEDAATISSAPELAGAIEHLQYAVFRRYHNQLTRAERSRLDNSIDNALFKIDRYLARVPTNTAAGAAEEVAGLRAEIREGRERLEHQIRLARRADLKVAQLSS